MQILKFPDPFLQTKCKPVLEFDDSLKTIVEEMFTTMYAENGIGLAAPQVGVDKQIIVCDVKQLKAYENEDPTAFKAGEFCFINPQITEFEGLANWPEACLSLPGIDAIVQRYKIIHVSFQDLSGEKKQIIASGLLSACIQHELDHLNGMLFIDRLSPLKRDMSIAKMKKLIKQGKAQPKRMINF